MVKSLKIVHLYPVEMNIYGDNGNALALKRRIEWRGLDAEIVGVEVGEELPSDVDMIVSGGGQDAGQARVEVDLQTKASQLRAMADDGVAMLLICGTYQLFGHRFVTSNSETIKGIGILDVETMAGQERLIGNITTKSQFGTLVGYENHSGLTYLGSSAKPLGEVMSGAGNNGVDKTEGATYQNVFGTYLHGPILPKNPEFADELIYRALDRKYGSVEDLEPLDDEIELIAKRVASQRSR